MSEPTIIEYTVQALMLVLILSLPPIVVAALAGIIVSLIQAVTQVQEQTISFAIKLVAVIVTILLTARWIGGELFNYALKMFDTFPMMVQ